MAVSTVGERIKDVRTKRGYTLDEVAKAIHITATTVSKYESDRVKTIPQKNLNALASFLKVQPSYLLGYDDTAATSNSILSLNEQLMLEDYRKLPPKYQKFISSMITSLLETQEDDEAVEQLSL